MVYDVNSSEAIRCPSCAGEICYRYGRSPTGKQKWVCVLCGRQFTEDSERVSPADRPRCPECGRPMHVYMRGKAFVRFRCAHYPECKGFVKIPEDQDNSTDAEVK